MPTLDDPQRDILSVSRLTAEVRAVLEGSFPLLWVSGEISNLARPRSGHLYFSLKDDHAQVRCALFRNRRVLLRFDPADGDEVVARVRVGLYEPRGDFQLIVEHLEPAGAGAAQRAFEALKSKLQAEGLFDAGRKRVLPAFPLRLGVVTSPSGAAIRDVIEVLRRRSPHLPVLVYPAQVQGAAASGELLAALELAVRRGDCDVLLLTRGGGSAEDLAPFNDERLARAIAACPIPVVSAVGHEIDFTIADFVADRRAPTPSAAAELIGPDAAAIGQSIERLSQAAVRATRRRLERAGERVAVAEARLRRAAPLSRLRERQQLLDGLDLRLARALRGRLSAGGERVAVMRARLGGQSPRQRLRFARQRLAGLPDRLALAWRAAARQRAQRLRALERHLQAVGPMATLQRGYAVLRRPDDGGVVTGVGQVGPGQHVEALLADGTLDLEVRSVRPAPPASD